MCGQHRNPLRSLLRTLASLMVCITAVAMVPAPAVARDDASRQPLTLRQISRLDQKAFEQALPQLQKAMEQSNPMSGTDQETVEAIAAKLRKTDESIPNYWPIVLKYLNWAYTNLGNGAEPPGVVSRALSDIVSVGLMRGIREVNKSILFDDGSLGNGEFTHCRIIFTQNPVRLSNCHFRNCVFELPANDPPNDFIKKVCRILLASNLREVSIPRL
jgi:hypothetical protein